MDPASSPPPVDPADSRAFQRWLKKAALLTGLGATPEERQRNHEEQKRLACEKWKTETMNYSPFFSLFPRVRACPH
jgi:inner membrane protease ATP23